VNISHVVLIQYPTYDQTTRILLNRVIFKEADSERVLSKKSDFSGSIAPKIELYVEYTIDCN